MTMSTLVTLIFYTLFAIPISIIDTRTLKIPNALSYPLLAGLAILSFFIERPFFPEPVFAAIFCFALFYALHYFTKGLGFGDVKYAAATGLACGFIGSMIAFFIASATALLFAGILLLRGSFTRKQKIPFAPFISFGTIASIIVDWFGVIGDWF